MSRKKLRGSRDAMLIIGALVLFFAMAYGHGEGPSAALFGPGPAGAARNGPGFFTGQIAGIVESMTGEVVFRRWPAKRPRLAKRGTSLYPGDIVQTLGGSRCVIRLGEKDIVVLGPLAAFQIDEKVHRPGARKRHCHFTVFSGACLFYLPFIHEYRDARAQVRTPTATVVVDSASFALDVLTPKHRALRGWGPAGPAVGLEGVKNAKIQTAAACLEGRLLLRHPSTGGEVTLAEGRMALLDCLGVGRPRSLDRGYLRRLTGEALGPSPMRHFFDPEAPHVTSRGG